ncbi:MAG: hypothetical protein P4L10_11405 [Acidobacteriaceae bacterium]|nr:hypothetical protein [Acidobacteriaceae bacterium]
MAYRFSLATVLRFRLIREEREERMLQQILQKITQTLQTIAEIDAEIIRLHATRAEELSKPVTGKRVQAVYAEVSGLQQGRKELEEQLEALEQLKDKQLEVYAAARRDREMLTEMHNQQREVYALDLIRREQMMLDDNYIARSRHLHA